MPAMWGLYALGVERGQDPAKGAIDISIGEDREDPHEPEGITVGLKGIQFRLQLGEFKKSVRRKSVYRPSQLEFEGRIIEFTWPAMASSKCVQIII